MVKVIKALHLVIRWRSGGGVMEADSSCWLAPFDAAE
jgi:hypothetical protein